MLHPTSLLARGLLATTLLFASGPIYAEIQPSSALEVSGFGRIIGGYLDEENAKYLDYSDSFEFDNQSLAALQFDWRVTNKLSVTSQLLAHSNSDRESGIEWLYLTYDFDENWQFRIGKQRTPFYRYSDVINVGFSYHWINPPQQLYNGVLFPTYEGININYRYGNEEIQGSIEAYWGEFNDSYEIAETQITPDVKDLHGIISRIRKQNLLFTLAFHRGDIDLTLAELDGFSQILRSAGYNASADSLSAEGKVEVLSMGLSYHSLDYFAETEIMKLVGEPTVFPDMSSAYITAGINSPPFTYHVTVATSRVSYSKPVNEIPLGLAPELDQLALAYDSVYAQFNRDSLDSLTIGVRYDLNQYFAIKSDISLLRGKAGQRSFFEISNEEFDNSATLYQVALEWVF